MADYALTETSMIRRTSDNLFIPPDPDNERYIAYLAWRDEGNEPDPYVAPPASVPAAVSAAQARLALLNAGLLDSVKTAVGQADQATGIWFEYATEWQRDNAMLNALGVKLGLSAGEIDNLFKAAYAL